jgi:hypothetical protein
VRRGRERVGVALWRGARWGGRAEADAERWRSAGASVGGPVVRLRRVPTGSQGEHPFEPRRGVGVSRANRRPRPKSGPNVGLGVKPRGYRTARE